MRIAVIIPTHNEEGRIGTLLQTMPKYCDVILADDSTDATQEIALSNNAYVVSFPNTHWQYISLKYFYGLKTAYDNEYEYAVTFDNGDNFHPDLINNLLLNAEGADVVIGQRVFYGHGLRRLYSNVASIVAGLFGPKLKDATCGLRLYKLDKIDFTGMMAKTPHAFQIEMISKLYNAGCVIKTVDIPYRKPTDSTLKLSTFFDWFRVGLALWKGRPKCNPQKSP